jgi:hypothetical protein
MESPFVSIVEGRHGLRIIVDDGDAAGEFPGYAPQLAQTFTLSKADFEIDFHPCLACGWIAARYQRRSILRPHPHGQGNCAGMALSEMPLNKDNYVPTFGLRYAPTEPGRSRDGTSRHVGSSHNLFVGINAARDSVVRVTNLANWAEPDKVTRPAALSTRTLSDFVLEMYDTIGYAGDNQIIHRRMVVHVPDNRDIRQVSYIVTYVITHYVDYADFSITKAVDLDTGLLSEVFPTDGNVIYGSESQPFVLSTPDLSLSCGVYYEISKLVPDPAGSRGFMATRFSSKAGHANVFGEFGRAAIDASFYGSTYEHQGWLVVGTEAEVGMKIAMLHGMHP